MLLMYGNPCFVSSEHHSSKLMIGMERQVACEGLRARSFVVAVELMSRVIEPRGNIDA